MLTVVQTYVNKDIIYGEKKYRKNKDCPTLIKPVSIKELMISDWMEQGIGFRNTTMMANKDRLDQEKIHVGRSNVCDVLFRMNPIITKIKKENERE